MNNRADLVIKPLGGGATSKKFFRNYVIMFGINTKFTFG